MKSQWSFGRLVAACCTLLVLLLSLFPDITEGSLLPPDNPPIWEHTVRGPEIQPWERPVVEESMVTARTNDLLWHIERAGDPPLFSGTGPRSLSLDAAGHLHIVYGEDRLYYTWLTETVDGAATVGWYTSLALDTAGRPHISYLDYTEYDPWVRGDLKYAFFDGASWQVERVAHAEPGSGAGGVAAYTSLALDAAGRPHISYYDAGHDGGLDALRYATFDSTTWITTTVDSGYFTGWWSSLKLDAAGRPHISYTGGGYFLKYARFDGSAWITETVDSDAGCTSLALDAAGRPHISYYHYIAPDTEMLKYAYFDGSTWLTQTVDSGRAVGEYTSLALDTAGRPHISYERWEMNASDLRYARFDGTTWQTETVDGAGDVGWNTSLALDAAGRPHIAYFDLGSDDLKYAHLDDATWITETIDSAGVVGEYASLALDAEGRPHVSYYDATNADLKYARRVEVRPYLLFLPVECKPDCVP